MDGSNILQLDQVSIEVDGRPILHDVSLQIRPSETHVLFGPNGSGKTSLLMAIMGLSRYRVTKGRIRFQGQDITHLPVDERARLGIGLMHQRPPSIRGIPLGQLAEVSAQGKNGTKIAELADQLGCAALLARDVNVGFSGGEIKKAELLQLMAQRPALALIDEPDAGVDLDSIVVVGQVLACLVKEPSGEAVAPAALIITHTGHILNYLRADVGHVLYGGTFVGEGEGLQLLEEIRKHGYGKCPICRSHIPVQ
ncbi:MAG TPA: ABC transporter ATP-binding protein [Nitrospira sp.]|nr:ABC transporter ATP-binding protein [Nitrospira sp.]